MASISKRPDGKWRARYRDDAGKEHARHFARKIDGQRWLDEVTASIVTGKYVDPNAGQLSLVEFFEQWAERQIWVGGTARSMSLAVKTSTFADLQVNRIRRSHLEAWVKSMVASGLAPNTIYTRFNNVKSVLRGARIDGLMAVDPTEGVRLPRRRNLSSTMVIPAAEDVATLLDAAEDWFKPFIALCAFAGLRIGEASAIKLEDINFLGRTLRVERQIQKDPKKDPEIRAPKYNSDRTVHIPERLAHMISKHALDVGVYSDEQWLFRGKDGLPPHPRVMEYHWAKSFKSTSIEEFNPHSLRHFFASGLIAAGCDVVTVQKSLGHKSPSVTLDTYSHLWPNAADRTRAAAASLMDDVLGSPADSLRTNEPITGSD